MRRGACALGLRVLGACLLAWGCRPAPTENPRFASGNSGSTSRAAVADAVSTHGPRLLPLLERLEPSYLSVEAPGTLVLIVDGLRVRLRSNGSFALADGIFPLARQVQVTAMPARLGGGVLFALTTPEDGWLMRAESFLGALSPIGKLDVPTTTTTPGFEAIYATIAATARVIAIDSKGGRASEVTALPPAPEYGPVAIVDDWFGAYVEPLRGLMVTHDAGLHWRPASQGLVSADSKDNPLSSGLPRILALREAAGELIVELGKHDGVGLSRRGEVRSLGATDVSASGPRSVRSWVQRWKMNDLGGWPIELAVTRGALLDGGVAAVLARGLLAEVRLRDGTIQSKLPVDVAADRTCQALQAEAEIYFYCRGVAATSVHRWRESGRLERLGEFVGQREVVSVSRAGVLLRGTCDGNQQERVGAYCALRSGEANQSLLLDHATGRERLIVRDRGLVTVLSPPWGKATGRISTLGAKLPEVRLKLPEDCSEQQRSIVTQGFWLERPNLVRGTLSTWVTLGDELLGVQIAATGEVTLGEVVSGASRALFSEQRVLVPDSSGFALESLEGGMTYLRPQLPVPVASTLGRVARSIQRHGCSRVGCSIGDWLRIGWSVPEHSGNNPALEQITAPQSLALPSQVRRMPRLQCEIEQGSGSAPRNPLGSVNRQSEQIKRDIGAATATLDSTAFAPFYAEFAAQLPKSSLATNWSVVLEPGGDGAFVSIDDSGKQRAFLLEPGVALVEIDDLVGRAPRRISDIARLRDGWYLLGTEPSPRLVSVSAGRSRVVSDFDPRSRLRAARLRMVRNRDKTRVGYLVLSARLRARDVEWFVYPVNAATGTLEEPIVVSLDRGLRACDTDEDGWLVETSMDLVADVELTSAKQDIAGRTQGLLRLTDSGICIDRLLVNGVAPRPGKVLDVPRRAPADVQGRHWDENGRIRKVSCKIVESGAR